MRRQLFERDYFPLFAVPGLFDLSPETCSLKEIAPAEPKINVPVGKGLKWIDLDSIDRIGLLVDSQMKRKQDNGTRTGGGAFPQLCHPVGMSINGRRFLDMCDPTSRNESHGKLSAILIFLQCST